MKNILVVLAIVLALAGCGEDGVSYVKFYADYSIIWLDPSGIGVSESYYVEGKSYEASSGTGIVWWGDGSSSWWADVRIKAGEDAPLLGILPTDGNDATTTLYLGVGWYDVDSITSIAEKYFGTMDAPEFYLYPLKRE